MNKEDYFKYYIQGSDHYLIPKDVFIELFEEMENWKEEVKELKKQLTTYKILHRDYKVDNLKNISKIEEMENQQKEFIEYLENGVQECNNYSKYIEKKVKELKQRSYGKTYIANEIMKNEVAKKILEEILSKYKK